MKIRNLKTLIFKNKKSKMNEKGVAMEYLFWLILGVIVLVVIIIIIGILTGKGSAAIEYIKDLFRWGG